MCIYIYDIPEDRDYFFSTVFYFFFFFLSWNKQLLQSLQHLHFSNPVKPQESWILDLFFFSCFIFVVCVSVLKCKGIWLSRKGSLGRGVCVDFAVVVGIHVAISHSVNDVWFLISSPPPILIRRQPFSRIAIRNIGIYSKICRLTQVRV